MQEKLPGLLFYPGA